MNLKITPKPETFRRYYKPLEPIIARPKNRVYTATVLSFLTVSLFAWYAIRPTVQTIFTLRREIKDNTLINDQMETKINALVEAQATYQQNSSRLELLNQAIPESPDVVGLILQMQNLATNVNATISATSTSDVLLNQQTKTTTPDKSVLITPINITIVGTYQSVKEFINGLNNMRRIITISDINILPAAKAEQNLNPSIIVTIKLKTYSLNE